ncbi:MAG TPA: HAD-IA family hydrolase [Armatimonadota bacterium]
MISASDCAVIFDLDGVIVDTKAAHKAAFLQLGDEVGYSMTDEQFRHAFGRRNEEIFPYLYGQPLPPERVAWLADRKEAIFRDLVRGKVQALPGVPKLLPALRDAGFHLAIGTSTPRANVDLILDALQIAALFETIVSAENVTKGKPDPQVFCLGAERLGIPPARCVVVEDAIAGVQAARRGGMKALGVTTNHERESLHEANRVVDSLAEVTPTDFLAMLTA